VWFCLKQLWVYHCILVPWKKQKLKNASQRFLSVLLSNLVYVLREQRESCIGLSCHFGLQKVEFLCWYNLWRKKKENYCLAWIAGWVIQSLKYVFWEIIYQMQNNVFTRVFLCFQLWCYVKVPETWYLGVQDQTVALSRLGISLISIGSSGLEFWFLHRLLILIHQKWMDVSNALGSECVGWRAVKGFIATPYK
jgi:hypothetical protein